MKNSIGALLLTTFFSIGTAFHVIPDKSSHELTFVDHLKAGLIEQDVFVEKVPGSGLVYRVLPEEREQFLDSKVYTSAASLRHDPFDKSKLGPYMIGEDLGITLEEWLSASGSAKCTCEGGWGKFEATFENLLPNAVYTLWHFFMPAPPTEPFTGALELPLGDRDGSQSVFTTDSDGGAEIELRFERCLQLGEHQLMSGVAIAYHSDNRTYASSPGAFGKASHVQLFAMLPNVRDLPSN